MLKQLGAALLATILAVSAVDDVFAQEEAKGEPTWTVNFKDSDIREVIKFVSEVTGKTVVIDPRVKGRVEVISQHPLNERQLLDLFRSVLEVHDFTLIEVSNVVRIVPLKDARSSPLPVTDNADLEDGYVTEVIQLKNIAAAKVLPVLRPLVPQHSHLAAYDPSNAIVVSDTAANIRRVKEIIEKIDTAALPTTEIVQLKHADAEDLVATMEKLDRQGNKNASPSNQLMLVADARNNAVLVTGEDIQRDRAKTLIRRLDRPQRQSGNVRVVYLEYAKAKDVATVLTKVVQNMQKLTPGEKGKNQGGATVEADEETNALLITANVDIQNSLMSVIERLDIRRAQVLVEAIIVEVNADSEERLGVEWVFSNADDGILGSSISGNAPVGSIASGAVQGGDEGLTTMLGGLAGTTGQVLGAVGTNGAEKFVTLLTALKKSDDANILSTPSLMTMDNHEASISVGQEVPFQTGSYTSTGNSGISSPFTTTQREEVGILLTVTPQVNEGDKILLDVSQEVSSLTNDSVGGQPITSQSKIETQILAKDGEILVLGGLIKDDIQDGNQRVPLLGDIPLIGNLFKYQSTSYNRSNLMVFLRAKIIRSDEDLTGASAEKYRFVRDIQLRQRKKGLQLMDDDIVPVLPELDDNILFDEHHPTDEKE